VCCKGLFEDSQKIQTKKEKIISCFFDFSFCGGYF